MYESRVPLPQDRVPIHTSRTKFFALSTRKALLSLFSEFAYKMGANTTKVQARIVELGELVRSAEELYLSQDYEGSLCIMGNAQDLTKEIELEVLELKDRAMMWIHIIKWLAILGTSIFFGTILGLIRVRRKLYRDVGMTRAR